MPTAGLSTALTISFCGFDGTTAVFDWSLSNSGSAASHPGLRIPAWGFAVHPSTASASTMSTIFGTGGPGMFPGTGLFDICWQAGPICPGGGGGGLGLGLTDTAKLTLTFAAATDGSTIHPLAVRDQTVGLDGEGSGIGTGTLVRGHATRAMLIPGLGLVGASLHAARAQRTSLPDGAPAARHQPRRRAPAGGVSHVVVAPPSITKLCPVV